MAEKNKEESICVQMIFIMRDRAAAIPVMETGRTAVTVIMGAAVLAAEGPEAQGALWGLVG